MTDTAPRTDQKAGYCANCRGGSHGLCVSVKCSCTARGHSLRARTRPKVVEFPTKQVTISAKQSERMQKALGEPLHVVPSPIRRTEVEVAAEVLVALVDAGVVPGRRAGLKRLAEATRVPLAALVTARAHITQNGYRPPSADLTSVERVSAEPERSPAYTSKLRKGHATKQAKKEPVAGMRICSRCGELKPKSDYHVKNPTTGTLRSSCIVCIREKSRERHLVLRKASVLLDLMAGDPCIGTLCPGCGKPFAVGERVVGAGLRHEGCT